MWYKSALPIIILSLLFIISSGCTVYKRAEYNNTERIFSENPVKIKSIVLRNNETIVIDQNVALVEVKKDFIKIRYLSGDTLMVNSSEIKLVVVKRTNKSASIGVNSLIVIGYVTGGIIVICGIMYLLFYLITLGQV